MKKLIDLNVKEFLLVTASAEPVPGGGSISALCGALSAALGQMVANLTIGKKKYAYQDEVMKKIAAVFDSCLDEFTQAIDADSEAYNAVFAAFKLPKETEEEKIFRMQKIQEATKVAAEVPLQVAKNALRMMDIIYIVAKSGNQNAITDACVAMMCARTAVMGALLNVKINLSSIHDMKYVIRMKKEMATMKSAAMEREKKLLNGVRI
jgi:formiminotetrahydrofolate cyclodeaminase